MRRRLSLAVLISLGAHALAGVLIVGSSLWRAWPAVPVDVELTGMRLEDLQDLPLGAPASGEGRPAAAEAPPPRDSLDHAVRDLASPRARTKPERDHGPRAPVTDPAGGAAPPRPTSVRSYAPEGTRVTALMRVDRLRGTPYASAVDALLMNLPDRRDLLEGTGVDLYRDIDAVLIATPNPLDPRVTFLAARHRLTDAAMREALERGARATGRRLSWRSERGRPFAERRADAGGSAMAAVPDPPGRRDHRLILLAAPHLIVVTPPAYRSLILRGGGPVTAGGGGRAGAGAATGAAGGAGGSAADPAGQGAAGAGGTAAGAAENSGGGWAALLRRIDAEDSILPADAVAMVAAADLFAPHDLRASPAAAPGTRGAVDDEAGWRPPQTAGATILGLPTPTLLTATLGIAPRPFADLDATFASQAAAARWEEEWPTWRARLLSNPLVVLSGFSALLARTTVSRAGGSLHVRIDATELETIRLLQLIAAQLPALRP